MSAAAGIAGADSLVTLHYRIAMADGPEAGVVRLLDDHAATVDFNHPLAGRAVRFEVEVLAVL